MSIADTKLFVQLVNLLTQNKAKLLQELKLGPKRTINWNKNLFKVTTKAQNQYLDYLIDPSSQGVNRLFVLSFKGNANRKRYTGYFLLKVEIKDNDVMIDGRNFFDQPLKNDLRTYKSIQNFTAGQEDDCITGCLLFYTYFNENYKMITIDLSKQQALDADAKRIQQTNFTGNQDQVGKKQCFSLLKKKKKIFWIFCKEL